jgi:hypothetical protein
MFCLSQCQVWARGTKGQSGKGLPVCACLCVSARRQVHRTGRHKEEIMRLKNFVPLCLCAFDPQAIPFRDSSWLLLKGTPASIIWEIHVVLLKKMIATICTFLVPLQAFPVLSRALADAWTYICLYCNKERGVRLIINSELHINICFLANVREMGL